MWFIAPLPSPFSPYLLCCTHSGVHQHSLVDELDGDRFTIFSLQNCPAQQVSEVMARYSSDFTTKDLALLRSCSIPSAAAPVTTTAMASKTASKSGKKPPVAVHREIFPAEVAEIRTCSHEQFALVSQSLSICV
jgi:hypothetical protein